MTSEGISRRSMLAGGAAAATLGLAGCMTPPTRRLPDEASCGSGWTPFLVGEQVRKAWGGPARYFDAHTHFFNAHDVPVSQFLSESLGHNLPLPLWPVVALLGPAVQKVAYKVAPTAREELDDLCRKASGTSPLLGLGDLDDEIRKQQELVSEELAKALLGSSLHRLFDDSVKGIAPGRKAFVVPGGGAGFGADFILQSMQRGTVYSSGSGGALKSLRPGEKGFLPPFLSQDERNVGEIGGLLAFVGALLGPRHHNVRSFMANYAAGSPDLPLSGCFAAMVDFNYWLRMPTSITHMRDQVLLHEQLSLLSGGFVLPVFGYNPWADIREADESIEALKWAVTEHGCVGAKIYPPMGYFPYGNALEKHRLLATLKRRPNLKKLDAHLAAFHGTCAELGIPVMAHANDSIGRDDVHDTLGGPSGWAEVAALMRDRKQVLNVNLGHFGGTEIDAKPESQWTAEFIQLMASQRNLKIYGDIGHWESLLDPAKGPAARDRLKGYLAIPLTENEPGKTVANRLMYGTDWHMLAKLNGWPTYASAMLRMFRDDFKLPEPALAGIFGGNALDCYGLSLAAQGPNRERLKAHFLRKAGGLPGWM